MVALKSPLVLLHLKRILNFKCTVTREPCLYRTMADITLHRVSNGAAWKVHRPTRGLPTGEHLHLGRITMVESSQATCDLCTSKTKGRGGFLRARVCIPPLCTWDIHRKCITRRPRQCSPKAIPLTIVIPHNNSPPNDGMIVSRNRLHRCIVMVTRRSDCVVFLMDKSDHE